MLKNKAFFFLQLRGNARPQGRDTTWQCAAPNEVRRFSAAAGAANRVTYAQIFDRGATAALSTFGLQCKWILHK